MAKRLPGIRRRMEQAAIELFESQGYAATTAAQIAERAGTSERTFFRHFSGKAESASGDELRIQGVLISSVEEAPTHYSAWKLATAGLLGIAKDFDSNPEAFARRRDVVSASPELSRREAARTNHWRAVLTQALCSRHVEVSEAEVCALLALTIFQWALETWAIPQDSLADVYERYVRLAVSVLH